MEVSILGTTYRIERHKQEDDPKLGEADGYVDTSTKLIVIENLKEDPLSKANLEAYTKQVIRHEIVHAFLFESGIDSSSLYFEDAWAKNEEMIDWVAIQAPKLLRAFKECDCL